MGWFVLVIILPLIIIIGGIIVFNIYFKKQIEKDVIKKPVIDLAYIEAEKTKADDEDLGSILDRRKQQE